MGSALLLAVDVIFRVAQLAILARVLMSWLPMAGVQIDPYHPLVRFLYQITDPILDLVPNLADDLNRSSRRIGQFPVLVAFPWENRNIRRARSTRTSSSGDP